MWNCYICLGNFDSIKGLVLHLKFIHNLAADSSYSCSQNNCGRSYTTVKSFRKHLTTHSFDSHNEIGSNYNSEIIQSLNISLNSSVRKEPFETEDNTYKETIRYSLEHLALWLYGHTELNRKTANDILAQVTQHVTEPIGTILTEKVMPLVSETPIKSALNEITMICKDPFTNVSTEHELIKNLKTKGYFVCPRTFVIDNSINIAHANSSVRLLPKTKTGVILPLAQTLKQFFERPGTYTVVTEYIKELTSDAGSSISNIVQSCYWKTKINDELGSKEIIIPLYIYFDDFECGNPLGSRAGSQSVAATYCQIACLPPQYSAMLENIFVLMLHYSSDKSFGNGVIFRELVKDLKVVEQEGVHIKSPNGSVKLHFKLALILGDNLGLNTALGFSKSFSSNYYCRICKAHKNAMSTASKPNDQLLRTKANYESDIRLSDPSKTGVREECVFNSLLSFHVVENLSVDIMHDIFEGVCHYDLCHIILYYIDDIKIFDLDTLNNRIQLFNYSPCTNIPGIIKKEHLLNKRLHTSASEMMTLIQHFPLVAGDLVPTDDDVWNFLLILVQIVESILERSVNEETIRHLESLIAEHHNQYVHLFKDNLKPKHHFMIHYPYVIRKLGPLRNVWCMRFEAKHKLLKNIAKNTSSRKNLPYTLIVKEQLNVAGRMQNGKELRKSIILGKKDQSDISALINLIVKQNYDPLNLCLENKVQWVKYDGIKYVTNNIIILTTTGEYEFYIVKYILPSTSDEVYLLCVRITCLGFNEHLRSYQLNVTDVAFDLTVIDVSQIIVFPCTAHSLSNGDIYCRVRYI